MVASDGAAPDRAYYRMSKPNLAAAQPWAWLAIAFALGGMLYLLSPILAPFLLAAILAYVLDPIVESLTGRYRPRAAAVVLVMLLVLAVIVALALVVLPLFYKELRLLTERLPEFLAWINQSVAPWISRHLEIEFQLDVATVRELARETLSNNEDLVKSMLASLRVGGVALIAIVANVLLVPVVLFYLLRDWGRLIERVEGMVPRQAHERVRKIVSEVDAVLAEFLRGQVMVILVMSVYYVAALWATGLEFALPIGIISGILVFIPYVGALAGLVLATIAAVMQFEGFAGLAWVWLAFGVGQALEGMAVTPMLVGERIGLHPVAVIFALLAFGHVFGFFGVLLALPASAALLVGLRHLRSAYLESPLYAGPDKR